MITAKEANKKLEELKTHEDLLLKQYKEEIIENVELKINNAIDIRKSFVVISIYAITPSGFRYNYKYDFTHSEFYNNIVKPVLEENGYKTKRLKFADIFKYGICGGEYFLVSWDDVDECDKYLTKR